MRLGKNDLVAGIPASAARDLMRFISGRQVHEGAAEAVMAELGIKGPAGSLRRLEEHGYLIAQDAGSRGVSWTTTVLGNALAMASFGSPMTREAAERLLQGLVERARAYNEDPLRPLIIERLRIFGSYLDPAVDTLGDLDVELSFTKKDGSSKAALDYANRSGRRFGTHVERLFWPQTELMQYLKNRSRFINITEEDISLLTDKVLVVYERG